MRKLLVLVSLAFVTLAPLASSASNSTPAPGGNVAEALPCFLGICLNR